GSGVGLVKVVDAVSANLFDPRDGLRIVAGEGVLLSEIGAGHEHITTDTRFNAGKNGADVSVPAVADKGDALGINVTAEAEEIDGAAEGDDLMHGGVTLLALRSEGIMIVILGRGEIMARLRGVGQEGGDAGGGARE